MNEIENPEKPKVVGQNNYIYVGSCPAHNWEGMFRSTYQEAALDLEGHIRYFPDESHEGAKIITQ